MATKQVHIIFAQGRVPSLSIVSEEIVARDAQAGWQNGVSEVVFLTGVNGETVAVRSDDISGIVVMDVQTQVPQEPGNGQDNKPQLVQ